MSIFASYYTVIYTVFFFYFNLPNVLLNSATAEIMRQGLKMHVVFIKHRGAGTPAPPVAMCCDNTSHNVVMGGGWVCAPVTASLWLCRSSCCQHVNCFISTQILLFGDVFQEEGKRNGSKKNFLFLSLRLSMQYTFSFLEQNASDSVKTEIGIQKTIRENLQLDLQTFYRFLGLRFSY